LGKTGWYTTWSSTSEVPSGITNFQNTVPATETLPVLHLVGSTIMVVKSTTDLRPWPAIGHDVTAGR